MNQPNFPNLLTEEKAEQLERLLEGLEKIANAMNRWNDLLREAGYPTKMLTIRHNGDEERLFFGENSAALELQKKLLLHKIDKLDLLHPAAPARRAA